MRKALAIMTLAVPALAVAAGCSAHYAAPQADKTRHGGPVQAIRPPAVTSVPYAAAELTGRLGPVNLGAGQYNQYVVFTNTSRRDCMLSGAPSEVAGARRDERKVRLATGAALGMNPGFGLLPGPAKLRPGQGAQIVIHTTPCAARRLPGRQRTSSCSMSASPKAARCRSVSAPAAIRRDMRHRRQHFRHSQAQLLTRTIHGAAVLWTRSTGKSPATVVIHRQKAARFTWAPTALRKRYAGPWA
jgi:hypothetical protein